MKYYQLKAHLVDEETETRGVYKVNTKYITSHLIPTRGKTMSEDMTYLLTQRNLVVTYPTNGSKEDIIIQTTNLQLLRNYVKYNTVDKSYKDRTVKYILVDPTVIRFGNIPVEERAKLNPDSPEVFYITDYEEKKDYLEAPHSEYSHKKVKIEFEVIDDCLTEEESKEKIETLFKKLMSTRKQVFNIKVKSKTQF